jgi:putative hemolysin
LFRDIRPAVFVSESTHALKLLEIFREEQQSIALVVDEYGDIQGMVTTSDVMGAILGRLQSPETDEADAMVALREDGSLLVDGALPIEDVRELLGGISLPDLEALDYHTAAGMAIAHFGRIPNVGEYFDWDGWRIEIVDLDGPRVDKLLLVRLPQEARDA